MQSCKYGHTSTKACQKVYNTHKFEPWFSHDRSIDFQDYFCLVQGRQELSFDRHASNVRKDTLSKPTGDSVYRAEMRYSKSQRSSIAQRKDHKNLTRLKVCSSRLKVFWRLRSRCLSSLPHRRDEVACDPWGLSREQSHCNCKPRWLVKWQEMNHMWNVVYAYIVQGTSLETPCRKILDTRFFSSKKRNKGYKKMTFRGKNVQSKNAKHMVHFFKIILCG